MKLKRLWFWITYYGVAVVANVVATIVCRDKINFSVYSTFPIGYITYLLLLVWYSRSDFRTHLWVFIWNRRHDSFSNLPEEERPHDTFEKSHPQLHPGGVLNSKVYLLFIPLFTVFIFLFSDKVKVHSAWIFLAIIIIITAIGIWSMVTDDIDGRRVKFQKELEEQKKKESMGKWK